jgi:hypothetical protein
MCFAGSGQGKSLINHSGGLVFTSAREEAHVHFVYHN